MIHGTIASLIVMINVSEITELIGDLFMTILGSELLIGALLFMFFMIFTLILGLGMLVGSVIIIPSLFLVFEFIPDIKIIVAIVIGMVVGLALNKIIRR